MQAVMDMEGLVRYQYFNFLQTQTDFKFCSSKSGFQQPYDHDYSREIGPRCGKIVPALLP